MREEAEENINGIKVGRETPAISHLLYADDLVIACRATKQEAAFVRECFKKYCLWSGQLANEDKSSIYFSKGTDKRVKQGIKRITRLKEMKTTSIYLGNSLILGRSKVKDFGRLKEQV